MSCAFHSSTGPGWQKWRQCAVCELGWQGERRLLLYTSPTAAARGSDSRRSLPRVAAQSSRIARGQPSRPVLELPRSACVHTRAALAEDTSSTNRSMRRWHTVQPFGVDYKHRRRRQMYRRGWRARRRACRTARLCAIFARANCHTHNSPPPCPRVQAACHHVRSDIGLATQSKR